MTWTINAQCVLILCDFIFVILEYVLLLFVLVYTVQPKLITTISSSSIQPYLLITCFISVCISWTF